VPGHFKGTEKNLKYVVFPVITTQIFTRHSRRLSVSHAQKMEQLCEFGAWHHSWKLWGPNHNIYSHYTSSTIYTFRRDKFLWHCLWNSIVTFTPNNQFWVIHFKTLPCTKTNVAFSGVHCGAFLHSFSHLALACFCIRVTKHWDFPSSLACVTGILTAGLYSDLDSKFPYRASEESFSDFFIENFQWHF
jgi:hypothetical protein